MRLRMGIAIAAALTTLAGSGIATAQSKPWRHGIIDPKSDAGFAMMGAKGGFAEKLGLKLDLLNFQNDSIALRALLAGEIESYEGGPGTAIVAASRNADVKIIGCHWLTVVHSIFTKAAVVSPQELKGAAFAISAPGAMPDLIARAFLAQNDIAMSAVRFASLGNDNERYKSLLAGVTSAAVVSNEFEPVAGPAGFKMLTRGSDVAPKFMRLCTATTGKVLAARRDDAVSFLAAEMQGFRHALDDREAELALVREVTGAKADDPRPAHIFAEAARPGSVDPTMPIPMDKLAWLQDLLVKVGNMQAPFDLARMVDTDVRAAALAKSGIAR